MPKRFYAAWAFFVILAAAVPIAVPYAIWPPNDYEGGTFDGTIQPHLYGEYALVARYVPSSVSVEPVPQPTVLFGCPNSAMKGREGGFTANVTLRGAYGIPFGSIDATCRTQSGLSVSPGGGLLLAGLAWVLGMAVISAPFILALERRGAGREPSHLTLNRPLPG